MGSFGNERLQRLLASEYGAASVERLEGGEIMLRLLAKTSRVLLHVFLVADCLVKQDGEEIFLGLGGPNFHAPGDRLAEALAYCNDWNYREGFPAAYIAMPKGVNRLSMRGTVHLDENPSDEYVGRIIARALANFVELYENAPQSVFVPSADEEC